MADDSQHLNLVLVRPWDSAHMLRSTNDVDMVWGSKSLICFVIRLAGLLQVTFDLIARLENTCHVVQMCPHLIQVFLLMICIVPLCLLILILRDPPEVGGGSQADHFLVGVGIL